jgi:hypothetical protein
MTLIEQLRSKKKALTVEELAELLCIAARTRSISPETSSFVGLRSGIAAFMRGGHFRMDAVGFAELSFPTGRRPTIPFRTKECIG